MDSINISLEFMECQYKLPVSIINAYIQPVISVIGIFLNVLSVIVFLQISKKNKNYSNMFKYFLVKSLDDGIRFVIYSFSPFYFCLNCENTHSYEIVTWYIYFYLYAARGLEMGSSLMAVMATFECFIRIAGKLKFLHSKIITITIISLVHLIAFSNSVYIILGNKITPLTLVYFKNQTIYYKRDRSAFIFKAEIVILRNFDAILSHIIPFVLLILFNIFIILQLKKTSKLKLLLHQHILQNKSIKAALNSKKKNQIMVILSGLNFMIGHFGIILLRFRLSFWSEQSWNCFSFFYGLIFSLSLVINVFFYYFLNNHFRNQLHMNFRCFRYKSRRNELENTT